MDHKERCKKLKAIRKKVADTIGVDLHQTECTYEGECKGTCPKCEKEEQILNKAIMGGTVAAAAVMLSACSLNDDVQSANNSSPSAIESIKGLFGKGEEEEEIELAGDVVYVPDDYAGGETIDPDLIDDGECNNNGNPSESENGLDENNIASNPEELEGELILEGDVAEPIYDLDDENDIVEICRLIVKSPIVEVDHYEENKIIIHCYEIVQDDEESGHTATWDWITFDMDTKIMTNFMEEEIDYSDYIF